MAEHILQTNPPSKGIIIRLRYDTYMNWMNSDIILSRGEMAVCAFTSIKTLNNTDDSPLNTPPAVGLKVGDGSHYFDELPWVQGVAADVYSWAKSSTPPNAN